MYINSDGTSKTSPPEHVRVDVKFDIVKADTSDIDLVHGSELLVARGGASAAHLCKKSSNQSAALVDVLFNQYLTLYKSLRTRLDDVRQFCDPEKAAADEITKLRREHQLIFYKVMLIAAGSFYYTSGVVRGLVGQQSFREQRATQKLINVASAKFFENVRAGKYEDEKAPPVITRHEMRSLRTLFHMTRRGKLPDIILRRIAGQVHHKRNEENLRNHIRRALRQEAANGLATTFRPRQRHIVCSPQNGAAGAGPLS